MLTACGGGGDGKGPAVETTSMPTQQRTILATGRALDIAIDGAGLFVFVDGANGPVFSRSGRLDVDREGHLVHAEGWRMAGGTDLAEPSGVARELPPLSYTMSGRATTRLELQVNLDARVSAGDSASSFNPQESVPYSNGAAFSVYDANGAVVVLVLYWAKVANDRWEVFASSFPYDSAQRIATLEFHANGQFNAMRSEPFDVPAATAGIDGPTLAIPGIVFDLDATTQYSTAFSVIRVDADGYPPGKLLAVEVATDGRIAASYDNGQQQPVGQALLARFALADRLSRVGSTGLRCVSECGLPIIASPGRLMLGTLVAGALEEGF